MKHTFYNGADHVFIRSGELVEASSGRIVQTDTSSLHLVESSHREIVPGNTPFNQRPASFIEDLRRRRLIIFEEIRTSKRKEKKVDKGLQSEKKPRGKKKVSEDDLMNLIAMKLAQKQKESLDVKSV